MYDHAPLRWLQHCYYLTLVIANGCAIMHVTHVMRRHATRVWVISSIIMMHYCAYVLLCYYTTFIDFIMLLLFFVVGLCHLLASSQSATHSYVHHPVSIPSRSNDQMVTDKHMPLMYIQFWCPSMNGLWLAVLLHQQLRRRYAALNHVLPLQVWSHDSGMV